MRIANWFCLCAILIFGGLALTAEENPKYQQRGALAKRVDNRIVSYINSMRAGNVIDDAASVAAIRTEYGGLLAQTEDPKTLLVRIKCDATDALAGKIAATGAAVTSVTAQWQTIMATATLSQINQIEQLPGVLRIRLEYRTVQRTQGVSDNHADIDTRADQLRAIYGVNGSGVKIGVSSDSINRTTDVGAGTTTGTVPNAFLSATIPQGTGDLPPSIQVVNFGPTGATDEGEGMLELVHDIAPGSPLVFGTAFGGQTVFATTITQFRTAANCKITVDDVSYFDEPAFQDGPIAQAITTNFNQGMVHFSSAGNDGDNGVLANYSDISGTDETASPPTGLDFHNWGIGGATPSFLPITIAANRDMTIVLLWNQPYDSFSLGSGSETDMDLYLFNTASAGGTVVESSTDSQGTTGAPNNDPVEVLQFQNGNSSRTLFLAVDHFAGTRNNRLRIVIYGQGISFPSGGAGAMTIYGHPVAAEAVAVGAIFYGDIEQGGTIIDGTDPININAEDFSSKGGIGANGIEIYFDTSGNLLPGAPIRRDKPDIAAPDGSNTSVFGSDISYDADSHPNFFGTSAAAPNAAAVAALVWQRFPALTAAQLVSLLKNSAQDIVATNPVSVAGPDDRTGAGLIDALAAGGGTPTWDGGGNDSNWLSAANWQGDTVPATGSALIFTGNTRLSPFNNVSNGTFNSLMFSAGGFNVSGNALILDGATAINNTSGSNAVNLGMTLAAASRLQASAGTTLTVGSSGTINNGGFLLTSDSPGSTVINGAISGSGGFEKLSSGTTTLGGANNYSGATTITAGVLRLGASNSIPDSSAVLPASGTTFDLNNFSDTIGSLSAGRASSSATVSNAGAISMPAVESAATPYPSNIAVSGFTGVVSRVRVTITGLSHTNPDDVGVLLVGPTGAMTILMSDSGGTPDANNINLTFDDSAASSLPNSTALSSGTFRPTNNGSTSVDNFPAPGLGSASYTSSLATFNGLDPNGTWSLCVYDEEDANAGSISGGWSLTIIDAGVAGGNVSLGSGTLTTGADNTSTSYSGIISGTGGVTKTGTGTFTLAGANVYSGVTNVSGGTLLINNTSGSGTGTGAAAVATGATLGGTGTISGAITINGTLSPGVNGVGTLNAAGGVTFGAGSTMLVDVTSTSSDRVSITGNLNLTNNDTLQASVGSVFNVAQSPYTICTVTGTISGTFNTVTGLPAQWVVRYNANNIQLLFDNSMPSVVSINRQSPAGANTNAASVTWRVTFTETVNNVAANDFSLVDTGNTLSGENITSVSAASGTTIDVTANTGTGNGTLRLDVLTSVATIIDIDGNNITGDFTTGQTYSVDRTAPGISISAPSVNSTSTGPVSYTITYTGADAVTLAPADATLNRTGTANGIVAVTGSGNATRTITISSISGSGTIGISIAANTASDLAGNQAPAAGPSATFTVDPQGPAVVSIVRQSPLNATTNANSVIWRVTFSKNVNNVGTNDFTLVDVSGNISAEQIATVSSASGTVIDVTALTGLGDGTLRLDVLTATATITDDSGNSLTGNFTSGETYTTDRTPPAISISAPSAASTRAGPVTYTVTYTNADAVTLANADVTLNRTGTANGTVAVSGSGTGTRTVTISSVSGDGTLGISIAANSASDLTGNQALPAGPGIAFAVDNTAPTVQSIARLTPPAATTNVISVVWRVTFNESVAGVAIDDFTLVDVNSGITGESITNVSSATGSFVDVTANTGTGDGALRLDVLLPKATVDDATGNILAANFTAGQAYTIDKTGPAVSIGAPSASLTKSGPITYTVTYSGADAVALVIDDVTLNTTGTAAATIEVTGAGLSARTITLSNILGNGTISVSLAPGTASDTTGNQSATAGPSAGFTVDNAGPSIVSINRLVPATATTNAASVTWRVTFSETVSGIAIDDFTLTDVNDSIIGENISSVSAASGTTVDVTASTGSGEGILRLDVRASTATIADLAGNNFSTTFTTGQTYLIDTTPPALSIGAPSAPASNGQSISFVLTYSGADNITLATSDVSINRTGTANGAVQLNGTGPDSRTVTILGITGNGTLGISVAANTASDTAGNLAAAAGPGATFVVDNTPPSVLSIVRRTPAAALTNAASVEWRVTFSEPVFDASSADFTIIDSGNNITGENVSAVNVASPGVVDVSVNTGSGDGTLRLDVMSAASALTDVAGNEIDSEFVTGESFSIDKTGPTLAIGSPSVQSTSTGPVTYSVTYSGADNVALANGFVILNKTGTVNANVSVSGTGNQRTVTISSIIGNGTVGITIAANSASDNAGNQVPETGPSEPVSVDNSENDRPHITSPLTATALVGQTFSYTITATGLSPITFNAQNLPAGFSFSGDTITGIPTSGGALSITLKATNFAGSDTQTLEISVTRNPNRAPVILSRINAVPSIGIAGQSVAFGVSASDPDGDILTYAWDFGDGLKATTKDTSHVFAVEGIYTVRVTVSDGTTTTSSSLRFAVSAADGGVGTDNGGDDIWIEGAFNVFSITKGAVKFNFTAPTKDTLSLSGTIPIAKFLKPAGKTAIVIIGGFEKEMILNAKGQGASGGTKFQMKSKMKNGVFKATPAKFTLTVKGEPLFAALEQLGFVNATTDKAGINVVMPVIIFVDRVGYRTECNVNYKAQFNKSGTGKVVILK